MKIKKFPLNMILWLVLCSVVIGGVILIFITINYNEKKENISVNQKISFVLGEYKGNLALYRGDSKKPYIILEERTSYLNEYDRERVGQGISVESESELNKLIEDMTS
ncbi:MAG: hypothetical protein J6A58_02170 [Oscillospiraceae bacterium]|nr:hypothetical protein [Oscillospiraceae bacterium]